MFGNDSFLWYNVGKWSELGLAVPNFGNDTNSQNQNIRDLTDVIGRNLQALMFHQDARLRTPPSINTITRIHKLCTRARSILAGRSVPPSEPNMESAHAVPAPETFLVYPTPYFKVRNRWMKNYASFILIALTEAFQHSENAKMFEISENFSGLIGQYIHRVYRMMAVDLLNVPSEEAKQRDFTLTDEQLSSYDPSKWFTSTEMIDTVPLHERVPTEDDIKELTNGIPVTHLPQLGRYPSGPTADANTGSGGGSQSSESFAAPQTA